MRHAVPLCFAGLGCVAIAASCSSTGVTGDAGPEASSLWDGNRVAYDSGQAPPAPRVPVSAELVSSRVDTQGMMFAAGEMQISGEPFAQFFAGRNPSYYDRLYLPPDRYLVPDPVTHVPDAIVDLFGFSTMVESYEYSKYHMNSLVELSGAGVSLANGPIVLSGSAATPQDRLVARVARVLQAAGTDVAGYATVPPPASNPLNPLGFPGLRPVMAPYRDFDPAVPGTLLVVSACVTVTGYQGIPLGGSTPEYECDYNSLHLGDSQLTHVIVPAVLGFTTWKEALWGIDFVGRLHDTVENPVDTVADADRAAVGTPNNLVLGTAATYTMAGTYLGSTALEGMWGLTMIDGMDNVDEWLLSSLTTQDGATLGGFATKSEALAYDYGSPLRWFPAAVNVGVDASQAFPPVTALAIADATSRSVDLSALLLGNAMFFAMTDPRNAGVGQRIGLELTFDGDPFPADDGQPDGEDTAHDRALAVMRVAFVDLERLHADPQLGVLVDTATVSGGNVTRGDTVTTTAVAHALVGLRQTVLSLDATANQYGAADESPSGDANGILNALPIHPPGGGTPLFSSHVRDVFVKNAAFLRDVLTTADGHVVNAAVIANGAATATSDAATLESQAAAVRGLTEAFLLTGDESFRTRARAVAQHLHDGFYSAAARMFRGVDGGKDAVSMTAERFAWLQSALRETYKSLYVVGDPTLDRPVLEDELARIHKLYMNGWDDLNGDQKVDPQTECLGARLQLAEQMLTGETGRDIDFNPTGDRDQDCVPELGHAKTLSVFAGQVDFHSP